jgi:HPt (histidine-containing phosphotransfer) domain-containing protein
MDAGSPSSAASAELVRVADPEDTVRRRFDELAGPDPSENRELFALLVESFVSRAPHALAELVSAARRSATDAARAAHSLRGDALNLGGVRAAGLLADLEEQGRSGTLGSVEEPLERIGAELDALCRALIAVGAAWEPRYPADLGQSSCAGP